MVARPYAFTFKAQEAPATVPPLGSARAWASTPGEARARGLSEGAPRSVLHRLAKALRRPSRWNGWMGFRSERAVSRSITART